MINRDVFRRPVYGGLLTPIMGSGIQLLFVFFGLIGTHTHTFTKKGTRISNFFLYLVSLYMGWYHPAQPGSLTRWFTFFYLLSR